MIIPWEVKVCEMSTIRPPFEKAACLTRQRTQDSKGWEDYLYGVGQDVLDVRVDHILPERSLGGRVDETAIGRFAR